MARRIRKRDGLFVLLVLLNAICIAGFIGVGLRTASQQPGGWRRVDFDALMEKIGAGDLVRHEADWYRVVPDAMGK